MSFGNNGVGPQGAPIFGNQGPAAAPVAAGPVQGQAGAPANGATPFYGASFESVLAAVSRGEVSLNTQVAAGSQFGGAAAAQQAGNPTLLQAISQGNPQNGTNGLNGLGAGGGTVNSSYASVNSNPGTFGISDGGQTINAKRLMNDAVSVQLSNPLQYGGN
jgi:hypothetical protein